jgi:WD40 repeat protein
VFDPQGKRLFLGALNELLVYDPSTGHEIDQFRHKDMVNSVAFSNDGKTLVTAALKTIQFWDAQKLSGTTSEDLVSVACSHLSQNFSSAEWAAFYGEESYRKMCENLPVP